MAFWEILIVIAAALFALATIVISIIRKKNGKSSCSCDCSCCPHCKACHGSKNKSASLRK